MILPVRHPCGPTVRYNVTGVPMPTIEASSSTSSLYIRMHLADEAVPIDSGRFAVYPVTRPSQSEPAGTHGVVRAGRNRLQTPQVPVGRVVRRVGDAVDDLGRTEPGRRDHAAHADRIRLHFYPVTVKVQLASGDIDDDLVSVRIRADVREGVRTTGCQCH